MSKEQKKLTKPSDKCKAGEEFSSTYQKCVTPEKKVYLYVDVKSYFRIQQQDGTLSPEGHVNAGRRMGGGRLFPVLAAEVKMEGRWGMTAKEEKTKIAKDNYINTYNEDQYKAAKLDITGLADGTYTLTVKPPDDRLSTRPAGPYESGHETSTWHYQGQGKAKKLIKNGPKGSIGDLKARKYREVKDVLVTIKSGKADKAWIPKFPDWESDPWKWNYMNAWVERPQSERVYIDLKPDWWHSPTYNQPQRSMGIDQVVLHNTGAVSDGRDGCPANFGNAIGQGMLPDGYGAQYYIDLDGHVVKIMNCAEKCAQHGVGNAHSVAIEHARNWKYFMQVDVSPVSKAGAGSAAGGTLWSLKELGYLQKLQFNSALRLIGELTAKYGIPKHRIFGHSDGKKWSCPGADFWWELFEAARFGMVLDLGTTVNVPEYDLWFKSESKIDSKNSGKVLIGADKKKLKGKDVLELIKKDLKAIGYPVTGGWNVEEAAKHFRFHFYTGSRYHLMNPKAKNLLIMVNRSVCGRDARANKHIDRDLALHIRNVADYVRSQPDYRQGQITP